MFLLTVAMFLLRVVTKAMDLWRMAGTPRQTLENGIRPHHRGLIGDVIFDSSMTHVPEGCIYTEEWYDSHGNNRIKLLQAGEEIPHRWEHTPFEKEPLRPWVWVGNPETETDLTRAFDKYLVVGNHITQELVEHILPGRKLAYMDKTFKQLDFPGDGITIEENV
jgi:hypothetical protein